MYVHQYVSCIVCAGGDREEVWECGGAGGALRCSEGREHAASTQGEPRGYLFVFLISYGKTDSCVKENRIISPWLRRVILSVVLPADLGACYLFCLDCLCTVCMFMMIQ